MLPVYTPSSYSNNLCWSLPCWTKSSIYIILLFFLIYFIFGCMGSSLLCGLSLLAVHGLLIAVASLFAEHRLCRYSGFRSCSTWARELQLPGSGAQAQWLWCTGLVAPQRLGSSQISDRTHVPCISKQILTHCTTREVPYIILGGCGDGHRFFLSLLSLYCFDMLKTHLRV